jgi:hypothetical protein
MMKPVFREDGWRLCDELWNRMTPLLPTPSPHPLGCRRPRIPNRIAMDAILLVLRTSPFSRTPHGLRLFFVPAEPGYVMPNT